MDIEIVRDSIQTPWGIRLAGGADHNAQLTLSRVTPLSAADGQLRVGDIITHINGYSTESMPHAQASHLIATSGSHLRLGIVR